MALPLISLLLAACAPGGFGESGDTVYAPGRDTRGEAADQLLVGHRLMDAGEYELALESYARAAATHGLTADVLAGTGSANLALGRLGQAETDLRDAVEADESRPELWNNLGVVLMETNQLGEAARVFQIAFGLDRGQSAEIRENLRLALANQDNPDYDPNNNDTFSLVRRGSGDYLLLSEI